MPTTAWTYISFPGNAREAMTLYQDVFGGELRIMSYGDMPMEGMPFEPDPTSVAHASLESGNIRIAGGDNPGQEQDSLRSDVYSMLVGTDTAEEGQRLIDALTSRGGEVTMPFVRAPWGDTYGQVRDRFGVIWAFAAPGTEAAGSEAPGSDA
ncbi:PhnB protein [Raineyella antarctica]|uniref:PhnB protein n=1 Tax=Raineyella antarctica TaxID=1577474 RepID=A0A1G6GHB6_9ACTN|nr:VOC family protein [Raineyella antarctica]SDB81408.1 PhnB protein [Raineyella antarctica]